MNSPDKQLPSHDSLTVQKSASIFSNTLATVLSEESPFKNAPFIIKIAEKYLSDKNQAAYFTTKDGFGSIIAIDDGIAKPYIDLDLNEGLKSRNLKKRVSLRIGKDNPSDEELFQFAVGHELGHLIQGLADPLTMEEQNTDGLNEDQMKKLKQSVEEYNKNIATNKDINEAQGHFRQIFIDDVNRGSNEAYINPESYTDEEYIKYFNSSSEINADFISMWIMGMIDPSLKTSPQNEGYSLGDWKKWAEDHKIDPDHLV